MTQRVQVNDLQKAPKLRVQADVVDTFIAPVVDKPQESNLSQLAGALTKFEPSLQDMVNRQAKKDAEQMATQGAESYREMEARKEAAKANLEGFKQAIDEGVVLTGQSPWYKKGYHHEKGIYLQRAYEDVIKKAYVKRSDIEKNSDDPNALNAWIAKIRTEFNASNKINDNPDVLRGFNEGAARIEGNVSAHHIKVTADNIVTKRNNLISRNTTDDVKAYARNKDLPTLVESLHRRMQHNRIEGGDAATANKLVANSVLQQAIDSKNTKLIDVLSELNPSGLGALSTQPDIAAKMTAARNQIKRQIVTDDNRAHTLSLRKKKEYADTKSAEAFQYIREDPTKRIPDEVMFKITQQYPDFPKTVEALRKMQTSENQREDED